MSFIAIIYTVTAVVSIVIALVLFNLTKLSGQAKIDADNKRKAIEGLDANTFEDKPLKQAILEEINDLVDSKAKGQEVSQKLIDTFDKELEKRIDQNTHELDKKYEAIIQEEKHNEEVTWKKYKKVLSDKKNTDAVIRSIAEGLVIVDAQGRVVMMNPAAEKLLGVSKKEKVGKSILENLKEEQLVSLVNESQDKDDKEIELVSQKDDTKRTLRASSAVIENENGQSIGMVSVLSDITKQKELDQLKANFVSNITHELRTPLVAIDKSIALILAKNAGEISSAQEEFLSIAQRNIKRLSIMINDLLDLSKLEAGKMKINALPTSIAFVIEEAVGSLINWSKTKSISIEKKIENGLPQINIDGDRIIQVLTNLIGNAIKFTPANGNVIIEASLSAESKEVMITVQDNGVGISKEDLPNIFNKFYQAGERVASDINGTGIGLSIVKEIVELHRGKIWVESEKGVGARFIFTLPLK
ncbi:MAG: ATP-binding protein [Candidatus Omnitrophica bacterium]|nr:ATP-binding protein [Candidatus Omnitrophota bacterium]